VALAGLGQAGLGQAGRLAESAAVPGLEALWAELAGEGERFAPPLGAPQVELQGALVVPVAAVQLPGVRVRGHFCGRSFRSAQFERWW